MFLSKNGEETILINVLQKPRLNVIFKLLKIEIWSTTSLNFRDSKFS